MSSGREFEQLEGWRGRTRRRMRSQGRKSFQTEAHSVHKLHFSWRTHFYTHTHSFPHLADNSNVQDSIDMISLGQDR